MDKSKKEQRITEKTKELFSMKNKETDPFGSYTGVPVDNGEVPVQDADDL